MDVREFIVYGKPRGKGRPRRARSGHFYTPATTRAYEELIQKAYRTACPSAEPLTGAVAMKVTINDRLPKSTPKKVVAQSYTVKPDIDNVIKAVLDGLNGLAFVDDVQVVDLHIKKEPRRHDTEPCVKVKIRETEEVQNG